jgi:HK97 family phage prohead protease
MKRHSIDVGQRQTRFGSGTIVKAAAEDEPIRIVASNEDVDRYGDIVRSAFWELTNFQKNPVLLYGHNNRSFPVGKVTAIGIEGTQLVATLGFMPEDVSPESVMVERMLRTGFLNASSVGFTPTKTPKRILDENNEWTGGYEFVGQELMELSIVPVPALASALVVSRSFVDREQFVRDVETLNNIATDVVRYNEYRARLAAVSGI